MSAKLKIGTRGSALALAQAALAAEALRAKGVESEPVVVRTRGDADLRSSLAEIGRGAFTDIFSEMIARGELDIAVHSAKDLPTDAAHDGFFCLPRADARDALIVRSGSALPQAAEVLSGGENFGAKEEEKPHAFENFYKGSAFRVGTGSPRRAAAVLRLYPQAQVLPVRGNVDTRLQKLQAGEFDALVLAMAGLKRLGLPQKGQGIGVLPLSPMQCVPAACQGIIAVEGEAGALIDDEKAHRAAHIERACQRALGGGCTGGAGAYFDGKSLFAQIEGRVACVEYEGEESVAHLLSLLGEVRHG